MSTVRLLVLGVARRQGRAHGYAIHRELREWRIETWTTVKPGSIYHALKQLTTEGRLVAVGEEPGAGGPGRTVYELTAAGETEFLERLEAALASFAVEELGAGVSLMSALPRGRAHALLVSLRDRAGASNEGLRGLTSAVPDRGSPPHTADLLDLWAGTLGSIRDWAAALVDRIDSGAYAFSDDPAARRDDA